MKEKLYFILSMIIFGAVGVFAKFIDMASSEIALFMSLIGGLLLLIISICTKHTFSWNRIKSNSIALFLASFALCGNWIFLFQSYKETTIANAALSYYFAPVVVIMLSPLVLKEKLSFQKVSCVAAALFGLYLILPNGGMEKAEHHLLGIFYGLIAAVFYAVLTLVNKFIRNLHGLENTLIQLVLSLVLLLPYVIYTGGFTLFQLDGDSVLLMLLLGILHGGIGFYLFFSGMSGLKGQSIAILSYIDPLTSLFISAIVLGEKMSILQLIGAALLLGSTFVGEVSIKKKDRSR
ncbi:DMT family transporter [Paenibacillus sp. NPDC056579]|uniref:DMT family transporter n=1 Tax=Paenibacillus sp. NPDC056579 TaxID=3345871 RepID=UPI003696FEBC